MSTNVVASIVVDRRRRIRRANRAACELFGYEELRGRHLSDLLPLRSREIHEQEAANYDRKVRRMGPDREVFGLRADGTEIPLWIGLEPLRRGHTLAGMIEAPAVTSPQPLNPP